MSVTSSVGTADSSMQIRSPLSPQTFSLADVFASWPEGAEKSTEGRQALSVADPLAFALLYLYHHLQDERGNITFGDAHFEWIEQAKRWMTGLPSRDCYVAPRSMGKSTWWFLILPMWAAAFGHVKFIGAFADSGPQAQLHLQNFKRELSTNALLMQDFPQLCNPERRNGRPVSDNENTYLAENGFAFIAKGIDAQSLGVKVANRRPDLIILDDIEPDESNYSPYQKDKRLMSITDAVFPLNDKARVVISGTVTMPGSVIHELVKSLDGEVEPWITELNPPITVHHHKPIIISDDGERRSIWPAKWSLEWLDSISHTRSYLKNFANSPLGSDGDYWTPDDFKVADKLPERFTKVILSVDPAVTSTKRSDFTGLSVIGWDGVGRKFYVLAVQAVKLQPAPLRARVLDLCRNWPEISVILVEDNQGKDLWLQTFHDMPVPVKTVTQSSAKHHRAQALLNHYQRNRVLHRARFAELEAEMISFPKGLHDDLVDSVGSGVEYILSLIRKTATKQPVAKQLSYI